MLPRISVFEDPMNRSIIFLGKKDKLGFLDKQIQLHQYKHYTQLHQDSEINSPEFNYVVDIIIFHEMTLILQRRYNIST